jgi:hypothetical protein
MKRKFPCEPPSGTMVAPDLTMKLARSIGCLLLSSFCLFAAAAPARADVAPPDACTDEGKDCENAGPNGDDSGTCRKQTCTRGGPDGAVTYECLRCVADDGGNGCNCRLSGVATERGLAGFMLLAGCWALRRSRRLSR